MDRQLLDGILGSYETWCREWDAGKYYVPAEDHSLRRLVVRLHRLNYELWSKEDVARRLDVPDSVIRDAKRTIDCLNQQRNDAVEAIDEALLERFDAALAKPPAVVRTETPGSVFDRLSILSLKIVRMTEQTRRYDASPDHIAKCSYRLEVLHQQRDDLHAALRLLITELDSGVVRMRVYRQFKMYNDPTLNPELYNPRALDETLMDG